MWVWHWDFQEGNILVLNNGEIRLIDYDGMYIPEFKGKKSMETGNSHYQHCQRNEDFFHEWLDDFSEILIYLWISLLIDNPKLEKYGLQDYLLFKKNDLKDPDNSDLFKYLLSHYSQTSALGKYIRNFKNICLWSIHDVPTVDNFILHKYTTKKQNVKKFIIYEDEIGKMKTVDGFAIVINRNAKIWDNYELKAFWGIVRYEISDIKRRTIPTGNQTDFSKSHQQKKKVQQHTPISQQRTQSQAGVSGQKKNWDSRWLWLLTIPLVILAMLFNEGVFVSTTTISSPPTETSTPTCLSNQCLVDGACKDATKNARCSSSSQSLICDTNYEAVVWSDWSLQRCKCKSEDFDFSTCDKNYMNSIKDRDLAMKYASENCTCNP